MRIQQIELIASVASTNQYIKDNKARLKDGFLLVAHHQTKGKGTQGKHWATQPGLNVTASFYFKTTRIRIAHIKFATALALLDLLQAYHLHAVIKLPNDIYVNHKKIAGVLMETIHEASTHHVITGVGLNVNETFENALFKATSIKQETGKIIPLNKVVNRLIDNLNHWLNKETFEAYKALVLANEHQVHYQNETFRLLDFDHQFQCTIAQHKQIRVIPGERLTFSLKNQNCNNYKEED